MVYSLFTCARNWTDKGVYTILIFFLPRSGFVQQLVKGNWTLARKLISATADLYDEFGDSVAVDGGTVLVGATGDDDNGVQAGSVTFFDTDQDRIIGVNLTGTSGDDILAGAGDDDNLTGGPGNDLFIFTDECGNDVITDFQAAAGSPDADVIDLSAVADWSTYAEVQKNQSGEDTVIDLPGDGDDIILRNVNVSDLNSDNFRF